MYMGQYVGEGRRMEADRCLDKRKSTKFTIKNMDRNITAAVTAAAAAGTEASADTGMQNIRGYETTLGSYLDKRNEMARKAKVPERSLNDYRQASA